MKKALIELRKGEKGRITKVLSGIESSVGHERERRAKHERIETSPGTEPRCVRRLNNLGVRVGKDLKVIAKQPFGPIVIEIEDIQTAIGRGMAHKIYVEVKT